ncbi:MAG: uracil-DNA glycosylase [Bryobacterales bacterium]|jgi:uracil-DNA glycosylase family protein|nr:uracil-DNA glycosylase [Bryobacterales bacterium]
MRPAAPTAAPFLPHVLSLPAILEALPGCRGCSLYEHASQAVGGEGPRSASIVLIGEQPGDEEDRRGRPFVGPAGRLLDAALEESGIDRTTVFVTNAVKHFKFEERGKRRIHKKPSLTEIRACRPWLEAELLILKPKILVCLGATAAQTIFGADYRVTKERGRLVTHEWAERATATIHPSAILRAPHEDRNREYRLFVDDLTAVREALEGGN